MVNGLLLAAALASVAPPQLPNPSMTPGAIKPAATKALICQPGYTSQPGVRHVTEATKRAVFAEYGVDPHGPGAPFEVDHLISLELGGSNDIKNLWPQSYVSSPYNAHLKDALENRLHALVCSDKLTLVAAQKAISTAWVVSFQLYVQGK